MFNKLQRINMFLGVGGGIFVNRISLSFCYKNIKTISIFLDIGNKRKYFMSFNQTVSLNQS